MSVTAAQVGELRKLTSAGMMECKKALEVAGGDMTRAIEELRKTGKAKAGKIASRVASEGVVVIQLAENKKSAVLVEVNCQTDFVGRAENFLSYANAVAQTALAYQIYDVEKLGAVTLAGSTLSVEDARHALVAKVGENINIRRIAYHESKINSVGTYIHGGRIGVCVDVDTDSADLAKDIAMHIAAARPLVIAQKDVPADIVEKEKAIYMAQAMTSGKPQAIIDKMVNGRIQKFLDDVSLLGQPFIKEPDITVESLLNKSRGKVISFVRFEVGEGIEKEADNFVEAVMSQVQGS